MNISLGSTRTTLILDRKESSEVRLQLDTLLTRSQRMEMNLRTNKDQIFDEIKDLLVHAVKEITFKNIELMDKYVTRARDVRAGVKKEDEDYILDDKSKLPLSAVDVQSAMKNIVHGGGRDIQQFKSMADVITCVFTHVPVILRAHRVMKGLEFAMIRYRYDRIAEAHTRTFAWILEPEQAQKDTVSPNLFLKWLRAGNEVFWLTGNAGSGKSTLMKFLSLNPKTEEALKLWAGSRQLSVGSYYFWASGTPLQKSQEGLLRTLLFDILRQCHDLVDSLDIAQSKTSLFKDHPDDENSTLSKRDVIRALKSLDETAPDIRFCFFIDGLDEYDGDPYELVELIQVLAQSRIIKLCVSSRPWYVFGDIFGKDTKAMLKLEDLTRNDIAMFAQDKLQSHPRIRNIQKNGNYELLVQEIVETAQGVFLWVFLVLRSLLAGLTNADKLSDLQRRLRALPKNLEEFFKSMFESIEDVYQSHSARLFRYALIAAEVQPLQLITLSFLDEDDPEIAYTTQPYSMSLAEIEERQDIMRRRVAAWSKGLLEVTNTTSLKQPHMRFFHFTIEFLHRTVRDFLLTSHMENLLASNTEHGFKPYTSLCNAYLAMIKTIPLDHNGRVTLKAFYPTILSDPLTPIRSYLFHAEKESHTHFARLITELERTVLRSNIKNVDLVMDSFGILSFLCTASAAKTTAHILEDSPDLTEPLYGRRPLLDCALSAWRDEPLNLELVQCLVERGCDPNESFSNMTPLSRFLQEIVQQQREFVVDVGPVTVRALELLICHSDDLNVFIKDENCTMADYIRKKFDRKYHWLLSAKMSKEAG